MGIAEVERWLAPVLTCDPASVDEAAAAEWYGRLGLAHARHAGFVSDLRREKKAPPQKPQ